MSSRPGAQLLLYAMEKTLNVEQYLAQRFPSREEETDPAVLAAADATADEPSTEGMAEVGSWRGVGRARA